MGDKSRSNNSLERSFPLNYLLVNTTMPPFSGLGKPLCKMLQT